MLQSGATLNVSQLSIFPDFSAVMNRRPQECEACTTVVAPPIFNVAAAQQFIEPLCLPG
jgi:hypothetical protein